MRDAPFVVDGFSEPGDAEPTLTGVRVAFVSNTLGYLANFRGSTIRAMRARGAEILCAGQGGEADVQRLEAMGATVARLPWRLEAMSPGHEAGIVLKLTRLLRRFRPAVAFSFTVKANLATSLACRRLRIPFATNVTGLGTAFLRSELKYRLARRLFGVANRHAHTAFFQNATDLELFRELGLSTGRRTVLLPGSGVDTRKFSPAPIGETARRFLMISRLIRDKGVMEYLEAARILKARRPELSFVLVGPGGIENVSAIDEATVASFADIVDYRGPLDDVRPAIAAADCIVLPSYREGMPRTVLEAAAMGRPAVVTDVPGCRDAIVAGETGLLCDVSSAVDLARAMKQLADLPPDVFGAMGQAARRLTEERFDERNVIEPYLELVSQFGENNSERILRANT